MLVPGTPRKIDQIPVRAVFLEVIEEELKPRVNRN
jgi:hypothetical protein